MAALCPKLSSPQALRGMWKFTRSLVTEVLKKDVERDYLILKAISTQTPETM
jgi:hypothetical protein